MKRCFHCGELKPESEFSSCQLKLSYGWCRKCVSEDNHKKYLNRKYKIGDGHKDADLAYTVTLWQTERPWQRPHFTEAQEKMIAEMRAKHKEEEA